MKKGLVLVGDLFEDCELLGPVDVLKRNNDQVEIVSVMNRIDLISKCGIHFKADKLYEDINLSDYDFLFIPGGPGSFKILAFKNEIEDTIKYFVSNNKLVATICAAPMLVGRLGYFDELDFTVHPGFEKNITKGNYRRDLGVVSNSKFITGKSMFYSIDLGLAIVEHYYGKEHANKLKNSLQGE